MAVAQNQQEVLALEQFKVLVEDLKLGNGVLMRFLRARKLHLKNAEDMIRKFIVWRVDDPCNNFHNWIPSEEFYVYDGYFTGFDSEGRPVFWSPVGQWPYIRDVLDKGLEDDLLRFAGKYMDRVYNMLLKTKHQQFIAIIDLDGVTFSKAFYEARNWKTFHIVIKLMKDYEANFPELLHKAFMINTPLAFKWGWQFVQPFFSDYTLSKVNFYGSNETDKWKSDVFNNLPQNVIPEKYGGSAKLLLLTHDDLQIIEPP